MARRRLGAGFGLVRTRKAQSRGWRIGQGLSSPRVGIFCRVFRASGKLLPGGRCGVAPAVRRVWPRAKGYAAGSEGASRGQNGAFSRFFAVSGTWEGAKAVKFGANLTTFVAKLVKEGANSITFGARLTAFVANLTTFVANLVKFVASLVTFGAKVVNEGANLIAFGAKAVGEEAA